MADDRNSQSVYASIQSEIDRLSSRNAELYVKLDTLNAELVQIPTRKLDKLHQKKRQIKDAEQELKSNERRISQRLDDQKRLQVVNERTDAKETAYQNGIDPNAAWANATASGLGSVASVVGSLSGAGVLSGMGKKPGSDSNTTVSTMETPKSNNTMYLIIGAAVLLLLMMKKK